MVQIDPELFIQLFAKCPKLFDAIQKEITVIDTEQTPFGYIETKRKEIRNYIPADDVLVTVGIAKRKQGAEKAEWLMNHIVKGYKKHDGL